MSTDTRSPLSFLDEILCTVLAVGLVLVLLLPAARGMSALGWMPLWLVGMPAVAWWALRGFVLPRYSLAATTREGVRPARRAVPQARRSVRPTHRPETRRAA